ncbi:DUF881 domain-containing protein [Rhodococcus aerolatus]
MSTVDEERRDPPPENPQQENPQQENPQPGADGTAPPRSRRARAVSTALVALLCAALGLAVVAQVRDQGSGDTLDSARPADLVVLLDTLQQREASLREEVAQLQSRVDTLQASGQDSAAALAEARQEAGALAVLVGTAPATGPGVRLTLTDPSRSVGPEVVLDAVQELRAAGAEAIEVGGADGAAVRIGLSSSVGGRAGAVAVDGTTLALPYTVLAVGDPATTAAALDIPGGVVDTVARAGGSLRVEQLPEVAVTALRAVSPPQYAQPAR